MKHILTGNFAMVKHEVYFCDGCTEPCNCNYGIDHTDWEYPPLKPNIETKNLTLWEYMCL